MLQRCKQATEPGGYIFGSFTYADIATAVMLERLQALSFGTRQVHPLLAIVSCCLEQCPEVFSTQRAFMTQRAVWMLSWMALQRQPLPIYCLSPC